MFFIETTTTTNNQNERPIHRIIHPQTGNNQLSPHTRPRLGRNQRLPVLRPTNIETDTRDTQIQIRNTQQNQKCIYLV